MIGIPLLFLALTALPQFAEHTLATDMRGGYQVVAADMNHDGKLDLIALGSGMSELVWFENPTWERHTIVSGMSQMINMDASDTDGDGIPEIVLGHGFNTDPKRSAGIVSVLHSKGDPRQPWDIQEIDRLPTTHRIRFADIEGNGKKVAVNAPLTGSNGAAPEYKDFTPLVFYRPGDWKRETISDQHWGLVHGLTIFDWDGQGRQSVLTAGFSGVFAHAFGADGKWTRTEIVKGGPAPYPKSGSSDIAVGRLDNTRFLATIEPWHGNEVAVYTGGEGKWQRNVIDNTVVDGHTLLVADLDGDGRDEIVVGMRGGPKSVWIYTASDKAGREWTRKPLDDGGMAAAGCIAADLNGDKNIDLACIGSSTANLKWYENTQR